MVDKVDALIATLTQALEDTAALKSEVQDGRRVAVAATHLETAILWLQHARRNG